MQTFQEKSRAQNNRSSFLLPSVLIGGAAFFVGTLATIGYVTWDKQQQRLVDQQQQMLVQQQQMAQIADKLTRLKQAQAEAAQSDAVTRAAPVDLLTVAQPVQAPVATPALSDAEIEDARRIETLAVVQAGVQDLVAAVVAGQYAIHTNYEDEHFSGRIHFAFVGQEKEQVELENYISDAAEAGILAHSASVIDADGTVNGHIMLFDLVERALENGTPVEQRAGEKMREEAVRMLAESATIAAPSLATDAPDEEFYTVQSGDSLAFIALQFYGSTNEYVRIFEANRSVLRTPDRIQVGQRLLIPSA